MYNHCLHHQVKVVLFIIHIFSTRLTSCPFLHCLRCHTASGVPKPALFVRMSATPALVFVLVVTLACVGATFMLPGEAPFHKYFFIRWLVYLYIYFSNISLSLSSFLRPRVATSQAYVSCLDHWTFNQPKTFYPHI